MVMKMKFIILGILIAAIGLVLSHTYRPYIYENHINDFHLADVIGSIVCVPAAVLCVYGIDNRYSIKQYTIGAAVVYIAYEFLGLFHIHGTFDVYDIIAIIISSLVFYRICLLFGVSSGRQMVNSVNSPSVLLTNILPSCAFITWSTKFRPSPKPEAPFLRLRLAAAARSYFWKMTFWSASDMPSPLSRTFRMV